MPIIYRNKIERWHLKMDYTSLFVFGDNMERQGYGGQAAEMRGEPNSVGIPTKWWPAMSSKAFFIDRDFETVQPVIDEEFDKLEEHLFIGSMVFWPSAGIGTGLSKLEQCAPKIYRYINKKLSELETKYGILPDRPLRKIQI